MLGSKKQPEQTENKMDTSRSLRYCLADRGMKKKELAHILGVTPVTVTKLVQHKSCSHKMLNRLAAVFDMKVSEFVALGESTLNELEV